MRTPSLLAALLCSLLIVTPADARNWRNKNDARLTLAAPETSTVRLRRRQGIWTYQYRNRRGALATTQWPLILRFESRTAIGFAAATTAEGQKREALVLRDPDDCQNLASLVDDLLLPSFDPDCVGLPEDETYIEFQTEKFDTFELEDNRSTGNDFIQQRLIDDAYAGDPVINTPYLALKKGKVNPVGPKTGGDVRDGYGYGADDDFSSLVIMVDIGGARIFDTDFNHIPGVIRNSAGLLNTVSAELLDGRNQTVITASMHPLAGVFEPIALFDFSISDPAYEGYDYLQRVDSSPVSAFELMSTVPVESDPPLDANPFYDELLSTYYPIEIVLRAVVVARQAPEFIHDLNHDGHFTALDVRLAGYEVVSNEIELRLELTHDNLLSDSLGYKCLPRTLLFADLDGDGKDGEPFKCDGKSGSVRGRRRPR